MKKLAFNLLSIIMLLVLFFSSINVVLAQTPEEIYRKANLAYEDKDYEKAVSFYEMLVKMDRLSPEVFYNLGNSFFKLKKLGKAVLNYEKALRLAPRDRDTRLNLKLAKDMIVDKIDIPEKGFVLRILLFPYERMNINELTIFCFIFYLIIVLLLISAIFFAEKRRVISWNMLAPCAMLCIFLIFLVVKIQDENWTKRAIIISNKVDVRSGPRDDYTLQFTLHEGTRVRIVKEQQDWYEIDLSKDLRGWLPKNSVEAI